MKTVRVLTALAVVAVVPAVAPQSFAAQMKITSISGTGVYDYSLVVPTGDNVTFVPGDQLVLDGLSGVTGGDAFAPLTNCFNQQTFTSAGTVSAKVTPPVSSCNFVGPETIGTLEVDSSVLTLGTISWDVVSTTGTVSGTTLGPVAAPPVSVPEPAGLAVFGIALFGLVGLARRRGSR